MDAEETRQNEAKVCAELNAQEPHPSSLPHEMNRVIYFFFAIFVVFR